LEQGTANAAAMKDPQRYFTEIARLTEENHRERDPHTERRLLKLRHRAAIALGQDSAADPSFPEPDFDALPNGDLPEITMQELTPELLRAAILRSGALLIRGMIDPGEAAAMVEEIDAAFDARDKRDAGEPRPEGYYEEFAPDPPFNLIERSWVTDASGVWLADSPKVMFDVVETFERTGLREVATGYLGERPAISVNKCTLRRVQPDVVKGHAGISWHQDGAFLGDVRALNVWLTLSHCGDTAPGLDIVPKRIDHIVPTGTEGAAFDWSVSQAAVKEVAGDVEIQRPIFEPGDVMLFDELFLHATGADVSMPNTRYAIESWFFGPSKFPEKYSPVAF
jgi:Phytanoyl-CoA dioxygenase (PhyH)